MSLTLEVSKPERRRDVRAEQPANILSMSVTFELFQPERSRDVRPEQP